jgi:N-acetylglucosamine-6-phosphate deacetylase
MPPDQETLLVRNARLVLPDKVSENSDLLIQNGRIAQVVDSQATGSVAADSEIDLENLTLYPGFIDVHIHGAIGVDTLTANGQDLARVSLFLATKGVTSWLPTVVPASADQYHDAIRNIGELMEQPSATTPGARVLGVHYEGPFVNLQQCGALHREHFRTFKSKDDLDSLPAIHDGRAIHMMTVAPETAGGIELIRELDKRGWVVSIGHTRANVDVLDQAFRAGARHMTHFMNAMAPLHHRSPGPVGWGLMNDEVTCDFIADGIHVDPAILKLIIRCKTADRLSLISDAIAATGLGDGDYQIWGETIHVEQGRTSNAHGSIAGSVITILDGVRMMRSLGVSESEVARMASLNPARLLGIEAESGSIQEGKRADLVALNHEGSVQLVIVDGQVLVNKREAKSAK